MDWFENNNSEILTKTSLPKPAEVTLLLSHSNIVLIKLSNFTYYTTIEKIYELRKGYISGLALNDERESNTLLIESLMDFKNLSLKILKKGYDETIIPVIYVDEIISQWLKDPLPERSPKKGLSTDKISISQEKLRDLRFRFGYTKTIEELLDLEKKETNIDGIVLNPPKMNKIEIIRNLDNKWNENRRKAGHNYYVVYSQPFKNRKESSKECYDQEKPVMHTEDMYYGKYKNRKDFLTQMIP